MKTKKELKNFPKITFRLTPKQRQTLAPFEEKIVTGYVGSNGDDHRFAARGQAWFVTDKAGTVDVHLIDTDAYRIINSAIMRARKQL